MPGHLSLIYTKKRLLTTTYASTYFLILFFFFFMKWNIAPSTGPCVRPEDLNSSFPPAIPFGGIP